MVSGAEVASLFPPIPQPDRKRSGFWGVMTNIQIEITDTFGGEANYSWAERKTLEIDDSATDLAIVRRAKRLAGWTGHPCKREEYGDMIALRPVGSYQIMFITWGF